MIRRLLIANRGEIAVRVARAAHELGITALGIYSEADAGAYHLQFMDDARCVGPAPATQSYLDAAAIVAAATSMHADAVHPGYGFLSERAAFAQAVIEAGMIFVGPSAHAMAAMGSKIEAKRRVRAFDVPTVPGYDGDDQSLQTLRTQAREIGFPLLIKASAGGGGRGMRVVESLDGFDEALAAAKREASAAFGDDAVLLERYLRDPRHIEFQVLGDTHGTIIHLGERECSIQRRHQKIVEEAPSVALSPELRAEMGAAAVRAAKSVEYTNAGTCEFMLDAGGSYYFLEMNTRLQVEHPVTELVYGVDLVQWQLRIAAGEALTISQDEVRPRGWAIENRIYAEDPANHMLPSTGTIAIWSPPEGPGIRLDAGVTAGSDVSVYYDPMLAKLIVYGSDRAHAIARLKGALDDFAVAGVRTNIPLLQWIAHDEAFAAGATTTSFLAQRLDESIFATHAPPDDALLLAAAALLSENRIPWRIAGIGIPLRLQSALRLAPLAQGDTKNTAGTTKSVHGDTKGGGGGTKSAHGDAKSADGGTESARGDAKGVWGDVAGVVELTADATGVQGVWRVSGSSDREGKRLSGELRVQRRGDRVTAEFDGRPLDGFALRHPNDSVAGAVASGRGGAGDVLCHPERSAGGAESKDAVTVQSGGRAYTFSYADAPAAEAQGAASAGTAGRVVAPMPGKIVKIAVSQGDNVEERALLLLLEAMKMEHRLEAPAAGTVKAVLVKEGDIVPGGAPLLELA